MSDYYKVTTHDLRPPIQRGDPIWNGEVPFTLPEVEVDDGPKECAAGWNACREPHTALRIAGLWPDGRSSRLWRVRPNGHPVIERGDKARSATWEIVEEIEVTDAILQDLLRPMAGDGLVLDDLVSEVQAWRVALARPRRDEDAVRAGLQAALDARSLDWDLRRYDTAESAARDAARAAWAARTAWEAARNAREVARAAWEAAWGAARAAWDARTAWAARDIREARYGARDAWNARDALTVYTAARRGWTAQNPHLLTTGIRDAYAAGLRCAAPVGDRVLGYVMEDEGAETHSTGMKVATPSEAQEVDDG